MSALQFNVSGPGIFQNSTTMKAVFWNGQPFQVEVRDIPIAQVQFETDAVVRLTIAAICGTDLHTFHGVLGSEEVPYQLGHEGVGVVIEVGSAVETVKVGDRVIIPDLPSPGNLSAISANSLGPLYGLGPDFGDLPGLQAEFSRVPFADQSLTVVPNNAELDLELVLLSDIFCTAWQGLTNSGFQPGDTVAIFGAGPVGLLVAYSALLRGASRVFSVDAVQARLNKAASIGSHPINLTAGAPADQILSILPEGVNRVVDAIGLECVNSDLEPQENFVIEQAIAVAASGGGISLIGIYGPVMDSPGTPNGGTIPQQVNISIGEFWLKGLTMHGGTIDALALIPELLPMVLSGKAKPSFVFSNTVGIDDAQLGYQRFSDHLDTKVAIVFPWEDTTNDI